MHQWTRTHRKRRGGGHGGLYQTPHSIKVYEYVFFLCVTTPNTLFPLIRKTPKLTTAIFVAQIRKTPYVRQIDGEADNGQQKVHLARPCFALIGIGEEFAARRPRFHRLADRGHCRGARCARCARSDSNPAMLGALVRS